MEILTSVKRLYISFKSLVNDFVYSFVRAALLLLVEVQNHTVPVRERGRIRVNCKIKRRPKIKDWACSDRSRLSSSFNLNMKTGLFFENLCVLCTEAMAKFKFSVTSIQCAQFLPSTHQSQVNTRYVVVCGKVTTTPVYARTIVEQQAYCVLWANVNPAALRCNSSVP